jgi:hypothetical protein
MSDSVGIEKPGGRHYGQIIHQSLEADIKVDMTKKIKGSSASTYFLMFRLEGDNEYADGVDYGAAQSIAKSSSPLKIIFGWLNPLGLLNRIITGDAAGKVRSSAAYDALQGSGADFIAHPTYSYTKKNWFIIQKFEATVEGYPGFYSNIRSFDANQRWLDQNLEHKVNEKIVKKLVIGDGLNK